MQALASGQQIESVDEKGPIHESDAHGTDHECLKNRLLELQQEIEAVEAALVPFLPQEGFAGKEGPMPSMGKLKGRRGKDGEEKGEAGPQKDTSGPQKDMIRHADMGTCRPDTEPKLSDVGSGSSAGGVSSGRLHMALMQDRLASLKEKKRSIKVEIQHG